MIASGSPAARYAPMSSGDLPSTSRKKPRSVDSICAASCTVVLAKPKASDASPRPVIPASVRSRTSNHTVRWLARTGISSKPVTRTRGAARTIADGHASSPAAATLVAAR